MNQKDRGSLGRKSKSFEIEGRIGKLNILEDKVGPYELRIDSEGKWFHGGVEIVRGDIRSLFSRNLVHCKDGGYCVRIGRDECPVVVEDAPFVVLRVERGEGGGLALLLTDGSVEPLDPRTIAFRDFNVPYCLVRDGLEARFSRQAYYQLAKFISYDEKADKYYLVLGNEKIELEPA